MGFLANVGSAIANVGKTTLGITGTVLGLISPVAGAGVVTVGQALAGVATKWAGGSMDNISNAVTSTQQKLGLNEPIAIPSTKVSFEPAVNINRVWIVLIAILGLILLFRKKR